VKIEKYIGGFWMHNHDILIRLRYALDIKNKDMVEIFKLGEIEVTMEEVMQMLTKPKDDYYDEYKNILLIKREQHG